VNTLASIESKRDALATLYGEIQNHAGGRTLVFGTGNLDARLVIVGEAPGRQEEEQGQPFVGKAGQLLDEILGEVKIERKGIWVTNLVKWRPAKGNASLSTRPPSVNEINLFTPWLWTELRIIGPAVVLCLGRAAAQAVIHRDFQMEKEHGQVFNLDGGVAAMATYHPAYVLRFGTQRDQSSWTLVRRDLEVLGNLYKMRLFDTKI
jgi:uracil-DNA glycosylase